MSGILLMAVAGALGTLARYGVGLWAHRLLGPAFAWGTLAANLAGCFAIGLLMPLLAAGLLFRDARIVLAIGFLGAFTTFSTFGWETFNYIETGNARLAMVNVAANLVLGLACVWLGWLAGRQIAT
jgi:CrcB protein